MRSTEPNKSGANHRRKAAAQKTPLKKPRAFEGLAKGSSHIQRQLSRFPSDELPGSPPLKRLKHKGLETAQDLSNTDAITVRAVDMYNFSNSTLPAIAKTSNTFVANGDSSACRASNEILTSRIPSATRGPKRLLVKNLKAPTGPNPQQYFDAVWAKLEVALTAIFEDQAATHSKETLYNEVMIVCRQNKATELYTKLESRISAHVNKKLGPVLLEAAGIQAGTDFVATLLETWSTWSAQLNTIRSIFFFLDRSYLLQNALPSIIELGTRRLQRAIFSTDEIKLKALQGASELLKAQRELSVPQDAETFRRVVGMFRAFSSYGNSFEPLLLDQSQIFYTKWSTQTNDTTDLAGYVEMCDVLISQELQRCRDWDLDETTKKELAAYLEDILVAEKESRLTSVDEVGQLLQNHDVDTLSSAFKLLGRRKLAKNLRPAFEAYIRAEGSGIVFAEDREAEMVPRLLDLKDNLDGIWTNAFEKEPDLGHALRESFEDFMNKSKRTHGTWGTDNPKPGEMIAKYVDTILKGGGKAIRNSRVEASATADENTNNMDLSSEDEDVGISKQLDQVLELFRFVHGKAVFEAFYKRDLARRLLLGRSASSDAERSMLTRLKSECGAGFTHNLEQMFKDMEMARDENLTYRAMLQEKRAMFAFDLTVNILSSSAWPSYPDVNVNMPEHILKATSSFDHYYKTKHSGRKLEWKHALAHCQLKANFSKGSKELVVSSFQAIALLCFNDSSTLSYMELQAATGLDDSELKRTLQSLACAKYRVLSKSPKGKDVETTDHFAVNAQFSHPKYRIKINQIQARETKQENKQTHERVAADRAFETQAAIVRIMKARKTITHPELVSEVISATRSRGSLDPADIKKNIEKLIEKDYMERDESAHNTYSYVA